MGFRDWSSYPSWLASKEQDKKPPVRKPRSEGRWADVTLTCASCGAVREERLWGVRSDQGRELEMPTCKDCPDE